ncbi:lytic polysaccharide monooxygenase [Natronosporangium hydrolyticum]|uniref:Lytic polysaccharide monooxygenase n=1 Tax=Natronosporangium hydrolyticum TaxID=2811111 RepID=A0A895YDD9_9ACTN|nr:lytic polysaccharide monooxygenase [Natronosporangium hydrolyticum]QSB14215.1 lytic polysaccharide monooxygenase [Natronosporangium hydrolyticum]
MRKLLAYSLTLVVTSAAGLVVTAAPASAHGYVSAPPSRQALCAQGAVGDCGPIQFEPQSVEGVKGLRSCDGGLPQFAVLSDESRNWPAQDVGSSVTFTWVFTARHRTADWEYFIGDTRLETVDGGNQQPEAVVSHEVDLSGFSGRQTVLAIWNIGDTPHAFYNCVDVNIGGSGGAPAPTTTPPTTTAPTAPPATAPPAATTAPPATAPPATTAPPNGDAPAPAEGEWVANQAYQAGDEVTFDGERYVCRQSHTSLPGWEPSIFTLALWLPL